MSQTALIEIKAVRRVLCSLRGDLFLPPRQNPTFNNYLATLFPRLAIHARISRDPVYFPCLAAVLREGLFEMAGVWRDVRNHEANENRPAVEHLLIEKLAASILELANRRRAHRTSAAVGEVEAPLMRFGIVEAQAQALEVPCRAIGHEFQQIRAAIPNRAHNRCAVVLDPRRGARQRVLKALQMSFPGPDFKFEIMLPVAWRADGRRTLLHSI